MELFIHKYLSKFFVISTSEAAGKKIQLLVVDGIYYRDDVNKDLVYGESLLKEITTIFAIPNAKEYITSWAKSLKVDVDLTWYWEQAAQLSLGFPLAVRVAAQTLAMDIVSVQPMNGPTGKLFFIDQPDKNGVVMTEEAIVNARRNYLAREEQSRESWGSNLYSEKIQELIENQKQMIGISSRKKED